MGTISDKTTYLNTTKTKIREKINDLGQYLDEEDTFRSYVEALEQVWNEYPKVSVSDVEEASIDGTKKGRMEIDLKGQTEQEQLSGKNLFDFDYILQHKNDFVKYGIYFMFLKLDDSFKKQFTVSTILKGTSQNFVMGFSDTVFSAGENNKRTLNNGTVVSPKTFDFTNATNVYVFFANGSTISADKHEIDYIYNNYNVQVEQGSTATSYEPYCGGIPSPSLEFPQQIKNVTGNANVKIQNKNLFDSEAWYNELKAVNSNCIFKEVVNGIEYYKFKRLTLAVGTYPFMQGQFKENTQYTISAKALRYNDEATSTGFAFHYTDGTSQETYINQTTEYDYVITSQANKTIDYICMSYANSYFALIRDIQLEEGTTATSYVPHKEQNYPFTFAEGQRGMQGTTLEDGGIHQKRAHYKITGQEDLGNYRPDISTEYYCFYIKITNLDSSQIVLCNKFKRAYGSTYNQTNNSFECFQNNYIYISIARSVIGATSTDTADQCKAKAKTWLTEQYTNNTPVEIEYTLLANAQTLIPYNATQQAQYDAIKEAQSYDDQTNISQTNEDLPFILNIQTLKK